MRGLALFAVVVLGLGVASSAPLIRAGDGGCGRQSCTGPSCVPACKGTWDEKKARKTDYSLKCDYACVRGRDPWHAPPPECSCAPPCGDVIVKKRLFKADGEEQLERVPKYEVTLVPAEPCGCAACRRDRDAGMWDPLEALAWLLPW
jgi:hypothetical protein